MSYRARRANFSLVSLQNPKPIYMKLGWVSCLASIDRVTLADRTTFPHIMNNSHINKVKTNSAKPIVIN